MSSPEIIEISIKNIKNKYDIYFNKHIGSNYNGKINTYEGKNITTKDKIIVDVYTHDIIFLAKRIINKIIELVHRNIINIIDIVIDNSHVYIIQPYFSKTLSDVPFTIEFISQLIDGMKYLFDHNICIDTVKITDIYVDNNLIKISPKFIDIKPSNIILYGSPLSNSPIITQNLRNYIEKNIIINIKVIMFEYIYKINANLNVNLYDGIKSLYDVDGTNFNIETDIVSARNDLSIRYNKLDNITDIFIDTDNTSLVHLHKLFSKLSDKSKKSEKSNIQNRLNKLSEKLFRRHKKIDKYDVDSELFQMEI